MDGPSLPKGLGRPRSWPGLPGRKVGHGCAVCPIRPIPRDSYTAFMRTSLWRPPLPEDWCGTHRDLPRRSIHHQPPSHQATHVTSHSDGWMSIAPIPLQRASPESVAAK
jgi:hypothetical protein